MNRVLTNAGIISAIASLMAFVPAFAIDSPAVDQNAVGAGVTATTPTAAVNIDKQCSHLSDSQLEAFASLKDKYAVDNATKKAEIKVLRHQMFGELAKPAVDRNAVLALQGKINSLRDDLGNNKANFLVDASGILTPEQREQMHHRMLHHGFGFHHHGHGGPAFAHHGFGPGGMQCGHGGR